MRRKVMKSGSCRLGSSVSPSSRKCVTWVLFSIMLYNLCSNEKERREHNKATEEWRQYVLSHCSYNLYLNIFEKYVQTWNPNACNNCIQDFTVSNQNHLHNFNNLQICKQIYRQLNLLKIISEDKCIWHLISTNYCKSWHFCMLTSQNCCRYFVFSQ